MSTTEPNNIFNLSLINYKTLFPELTTKQYRVVMAHSLGISMKVLCIHDESSLASCNNLLNRACHKLSVSLVELRGLVMLRLFVHVNFL
ncbi:hypothetical protein [Photobacterium carnosum]|uniref:hypothetical protein n=1 Tax=Photobacterium carnosum TaxID=2023717 RepID=UPI000AFF60BC|nr:hypothetical protein [Photobacterium carnosum]